MNLYRAVLVVYAGRLMAVGLWSGRAVDGSKDFFVAGRRLGPGLICATLLAINIGAGSTVGAAGLGYRDGLAASGWVVTRDGHEEKQKGYYKKKQEKHMW